MSRALREALLDGQFWIGGTFTLEDRIAWVDRQLAKYINKYDCELWLDTADLSSVAHGATVETIPTRIGGAPSQSTPARRGAHNRSTSGYRGAITLDGVDDYYTAAVDLTGTDACAIFVTLQRTNVGGIIFEYDLPASSTDRVNITHTGSDLFAGASSPAGVTFRQSTPDLPLGYPFVASMRASRATAPDSIGIATYERDSSGEITAFAAQATTDGAGNYPAQDTNIGARVTTGGSSNFLAGDLYEILVLTSYPSRDNWLTINRLLAVKAGLA